MTGRLLEIAFSMFLLFITSQLWMIIPILVSLDSPGFDFDVD